MSLLHYITYKLVVIKDRRLGSIYYTIVVLIVLYTLAEIFLKKGYLEFDVSPQGTMRFQLSDPDDTATDYTDTYTDLKYCCVSDNQTSRPCAACKMMDAQELSWPVESSAISVTTFAKDRWQVKHISKKPHNFETIREHMYFTTEPEKMVIKIEHAVVSTKFSIGKEHDLAASERNMKGYLYSHDGNALKRLSSNMQNMKAKGKADKFTVHEILQAAGVQSLDEPSDALNAKGKPFRRHGVVLHVTINYNNAQSTWLGTGDIEYSYHIRRIPYANYRINQIIPVLNAASFINSSHAHVPDQEKRLFRKRYGIKLEFHQVGTLGCFSLPALLLQLVSGVGLLTLTATVVDILTLYILPDKISYRRYVYEESPLLEKKDK